MALGTYQTQLPIAQKVPRVWFDFSDVSTMNQSGGKVSKVRNKAPYSKYTADQGTTINQPSVGVDFVANKNVLTFSGEQGMLITNGDDLLTPNCSWAIVAKPTANTPGHLIRKDISGFPNGCVSTTYIDNGINPAEFQYVIRAQTGDPITITSPVVRDSVFIAISNFRSSAVNNIYVNNTQVDTINPGIQATRNYLPSIGFRNVSSGQGYFSGNICEIIIYGEILTDEERNDLEEYLSNKWGGFLV